MAADHDILIVGAGLTGLSLAAGLIEAGRDAQVIEARDRVGGRMFSVRAEGGRFDLGPAWFWPEQPRIAALADELGVDIFGQHAAGRLVFQDGAGTVRRDLDMSTMGGTFRLEGGAARLAEALADRLGPARVTLSQRAERIVDGDPVTVETDRGPISARTVILALPPRHAAGRIAFEPPLPGAAAAALSATATWMAGHAKLVAVYDRPFWREQGLNSDAISHKGPLAEIHDATPESGAPGALFGFVGVAPGGGPEAALKEAAVAQLAALYGPEAAAPTSVLVKDWAEDPLTAVPADAHSPTTHPAYGPIPEAEGLWDGRLHIISSEFAPGFGGFLEGALEAAETMLARLGA